MILHVSDEIRGRVDVVPGVCHVATEFVCVWFLPVLPRRSLLFYAAPEAPAGVAAVPVRLSAKSILFAYARPFFIIWATLAGAFPFVIILNSLVKPGKLLEFLPVAALFAAPPWLLPYAMRRASVASPRRCLLMAEIEGLPPDVAMRLRRSPAEPSDFPGLP